MDSGGKVRLRTESNSVRTTRGLPSAGSGRIGVLAEVATKRLAKARIRRVPSM
jgi:hypothetical protein